MNHHDKNNIHGKLKPKYIWVAPLCGAVISLIAFFTPVVYIEAFDTSFYMWVWPLTDLDFEGIKSEITFLERISGIFTIVTLICIMVFISSVNSYWRSTNESKNIGPALLVASIVMIISTISWIITMELLWPLDREFWDYSDPGFGIVGLFIGSGISILGYGYSRKSGIKEDVIIYKKEIPVSYCPKCGNELKTETKKFCVNCGYDLRRQE
ncbi:MAG: zinc ribbon domain-containing protein [Candidatus Thorarchaeota archaeon]